MFLFTYIHSKQHKSIQWVVLDLFFLPMELRPRTMVELVARGWILFPRKIHGILNGKKKNFGAYVTSIDYQTTKSLRCHQFVSNADVFCSIIVYT